jgi:DUF4097 and DUF4098 domain-containing protein YvlB
MEQTAQRWRVESAPEEMTAQGVQALSVRLVSGRVDVVGTDDDVATVQVSELKGRPVIVEVVDGRLSVHHEKLTWDGIFDWFSRNEAKAVVSIAVPRAVACELGVVSAEAIVSGLTAATKVKAVSGDVTLDGIRADVTAKTVSGDLETRDLSGRLSFQTVSGDLTVVSGHGDEVRAETVSGQVTLDLEATGRVDMKSVSGDLTIRLAPTTGVSVDVTSVSGRLEAALDGLERETKPGRTSLRGHVGDGATAVRARSVSGDFTLLRRASA